MLNMLDLIEKGIKTHCIASDVPLSRRSCSPFWFSFSLFSRLSKSAGSLTCSGAASLMVSVLPDLSFESGFAFAAFLYFVLFLKHGWYVIKSCNFGQFSTILQKHSISWSTLKCLELVTNSSNTACIFKLSFPETKIDSFYFVSRKEQNSFS